MSSSPPKKHVASRYLETIGGPLQPSVKLNAQVSPMGPKTPSKSTNSEQSYKEQLSPVKRLVFEREQRNNGADSGPVAANANANANAIPVTPNTQRIQQSMANLKLDSPSPLKRTTFKPVESKPSAVSAPVSGKEKKGYDYLCRIGEAKEWIEKCIGEEIPSASQLATDALRDGVILAKLVKSFKPELVRRITPSGTRLQFKHTENINVFFHFLDFVRMPDLFRFELTDLYDKKNIPRVIFCIHALSFMLSQDSQAPLIEKLDEKKLNFTDEDIQKSNHSLSGVNLPNFDSMNKQFGREIPKSPKKLSIPSLKEAALEQEPLSLNTTTTRELPSPPPRSPKSPSKLMSKFSDNPFLESDNNPDWKPPTFGLKKFNSNPKPIEIETKPIDIPKQKTVQPEPELENEPDFENSLRSGYNLSPTKTQKMSEFDYLQTIIKFQSISRGSIFRYSMFVDRIMLRSMTEEIVELQSLIRRSIIKKRYFKDTSSIVNYVPDIINLQSTIRTKLQKRRISSVTNAQPDSKTIELQSLCRGKKIRDHVLEIKMSLLKNEFNIIDIQSASRKKISRDKFEKSQLSKDYIIKFQSQARRVLYTKKIKTAVSEAHSSEDVLLILQSVIRANTIRRQVDEKFTVLGDFTPTLIELQSIIRGGFGRNKLNNILDIIDYEELNLQKLVAIGKGKILRKQMIQDKQNLKYLTHSVICVQSTVRGVLSRYGFDLFLDTLDSYAEETTGLQASIRGYLHRRAKNEVMEYYKQHLPSIIKIQSFIRGKYLGNAYKSLISMENPPLSVIKKFAHLLNNSDVDFEEEVNLTRIKESINEKTASNESLEKHIGQLDLKIALLQKNKITLDELLLQKNTDLSSNSNQHHSTIDVSSLNRKAKTRMELYEKFFYLLQTQPLYLTRLIHNDYRGVDVALKIFNNLRSEELPTREEYLFISLIDSCIKDSISKSNAIDSLQKTDSSSGWQRLLNTFNETQRKPLIDLFGEMIENIMSDSQLNIESDPVIIYKYVQNTPRPISVDKAIEDPETKAEFIANLQHLREFGSQIFRVLSDEFDKLPIHIRVLGNIAYKASLKKYPNHVEQEHLANAGHVIIKGFVSSIFESPDFFKIKPINISQNYKKNLNAIIKLISQLFTMKPFGSEDIYLQPLNKFINSSVDGVRSLIKSIIDVGEIDTVYNMTVYDDMTARNRPKLTLRISDMLSIDELIKQEIQIVAPYKDDTLREIIHDLKSNNARDISKISGFYTLSLNPSSIKSSPEETKIKALFMQAKRCVLYMIQVQQDQNDLFELLRSKIDNIHEIKFRQIINNEKQNIQMNRVSEYVNDGQGFLGDLSNVTYHKLKQLSLERILELESMGKVTRNNSFQILINEIAYDIKTKYDQRISRKKQLSIAENTLIRLDEKEKFLQDQLNAYNSHIDKSMEELQSRPTKTKRILPFTKQFFYERELKKTGKLPKFGAYKYSSKRLYEKGILVELRGLDQNLGSSGTSFFGGFNFPKIDFMFNCDKAGIFTISSKSGTLAVNGSLATLTIDELLEYQFENNPSISLFDGMVKFDTNCLINFIFKKFYHYSEGN
ncbi:Ras GTPase-activating-like protein IQGAP1 [Wickerhamomyces ciferrii]|uniref:Ras GTPase-activating-like protein IQGAP1 n=1 Tax=Wickerhamomyces ciferrii (strain ATCC 14091 / BCRC 22168 / CBS 111 / JCM 3599 / NBRC 0793 / NRRL Y-1031 F-60-10) TaxID=1206466 RepID=K0KP52_WICCF|nr:Ras GTPase-activating-like protein IQGAP1 [Wickerhamomyces ciferrii]CCH42893.1 Ras GTPase-activating-like protein IQGAP1 [Wickerhamomyces ciferrii]